MLNRKLSPDFKQVTKLTLPQVEKQVLSNGIPVYILNGGSQEIVKMDVMVKAGALFSNHKMESPLAALMLNEGTEKHTAQAIAENFDFYGAYFNPAAEKDNAFVSLLSLTKHFKDTLSVFTDVLTQSTFPQKEFDITINKRLNNFLIESEKTNFLARELFFEELFGENHPYGRRSIKEHYTTFTRSQLLDFYQSQYHAGNFNVILSGQVTDEILRLVDDSIGKLSPKSESVIETSQLLTNKGVLKTIDKPDAVQTSIRMGLITVGKNHPDYQGLKILITIFGGYFGSRLMKNIREEKGYTYGIHAMLVSLLNAGYVAIAADVKIDKAKETISEINKEIEKLQTQLISNEELELVRNYMMGELLQTLDGPISCSEAFKATIQFGMDFSYFENLKNTILTVTPEQLQELAIKYLKIDKMTTVVAGNY